jgi:hypothetical protein
MKKVLIIAIVVRMVFCSHAQNWQEWTQQKKTQINYLLQQIAVNKVYLEFAQKGYAIASKGLHSIQGIKNGDLKLHRDFFGSFKTVNPKIRNYVKVADIIAIQVWVIKEVKNSLHRTREMNQLTTEDINYCRTVYDNLLEDCLKNIDELLLVITDEELTMKDDERIRRIDALHADMQNKWSFCASFSGEMDVLSVQRLGEQLEVNRAKVLMGLQ